MHFGILRVLHYHQNTSICPPAERRIYVPPSDAGKQRNYTGLVSGFTTERSITTGRINWGADLCDAEPLRVTQDTRDGDLLSRVPRQVDALKAKSSARAGPGDDRDTVDGDVNCSHPCVTLVQGWQ